MWYSEEWKELKYRHYEYDNFNIILRLAFMDCFKFDNGKQKYISVGCKITENEDGSPPTLSLYYYGDCTKFEQEKNIAETIDYAWKWFDNLKGTSQYPEMDFGDGDTKFAYEVTNDFEHDGLIIKLKPTYIYFSK